MERWPILRDVILFAAGLSGLFHETVLKTGERPTLIAAFLAMCGAPAFLRADTRRNRKDGDS